MALVTTRRCEHVLDHHPRLRPHAGWGAVLPHGRGAFHEHIFARHSAVRGPTGHPPRVRCVRLAPVCAATPPPHRPTRKHTHRLYSRGGGHKPGLVHRPQPIRRLRSRTVSTSASPQHSSGHPWECMHQTPCAECAHFSLSELYPHHSTPLYAFSPCIACRRMFV